MCKHMRLEVRALGKPLVAAVVGAHKRPITGVYANVSAQVKVETEFFATSFEWTLEIL